MQNHSEKNHFPTKIAGVSDAEINRRVVQGHKRPLHEGFPQRLRQLRKKTGLSQSALGLLVDWRSTGIEALESGSQRPAVDTVERLAAALGVSPSWLAYGDEARVPFKQRRPRAILPPDPPCPSPARRDAVGYWRGISERLRASRHEQSLTLAALAEWVQISPQAVLSAEKGDVVPRLRTCELLAEALGVAPGWLAYGDEDSGLPQ